MVKIHRDLKSSKAQKAISDLKKAKVKDSGYNLPSVNEALEECFHGKCYICENDQPTSINIEHRVSYVGDLDLKYDYNNLFLSCAHCNNIKLNQYNDILDCTVDDVDELIAFRKEGYFGVPEKYYAKALSDDPKVLCTEKLLNAVYSGTTTQKTMEAKIIIKHLRDELREFKEAVRLFKESSGYRKKVMRIRIFMELCADSPFAAFKRWLIKDNAEFYPELMKCLMLAKSDYQATITASEQVN